MVQKIRFIGKNGYDHDKELAEKKGLVPGQTYTVKRVDVGGWVSHVELEEVHGQFNTVMFDDASASTKEKIRHEAHLMWEQAGRPEGRDEEFWLRAESFVGLDWIDPYIGEECYN